MDELSNDVEKIVDDYFEVIDGDILLPDVLDYTMSILQLVNDKKHFKKYIYPEFIKQLICRHKIDVFGKHFNNFLKRNRSKTVEFLQTIPHVEQRSPEWFKMKEDSIGASEAASVFGKSAFCSNLDFLLKKSGFKDPAKAFKMNIYCLHGTKYEAIVQLLYSIKNNTEILEFGSLPHPTYTCISASPDGITPVGVMIEIKVPLRRKITGIPPIYYWMQMQQQLQVCKLDKVDFVECEIKEYLNQQEYLNDYPEGGDQNEPLTSEGYTKNVLVEFHKMDEIQSDNSTGWIYPEKLYKADEIDDWVESMKTEISNSNDKMFARAIFFRVEKYSLCEVWRDDEWWKDNISKYTDFWDKVEHYRKNGYNELLKTSKKHNKRPPKCLIVDSGDD